MAIAPPDARIVLARTFSRIRIQVKRFLHFAYNKPLYSCFRSAYVSQGVGSRPLSRGNPSGTRLRASDVRFAEAVARAKLEVQVVLDPKKRTSLLRSQKDSLRVPRSGLHQKAFSTLRDLIMTGELAPGQQLNEAELSAALGVSRTPLREALKLLAAENLVELRINRSAIVTPLRREEIVASFEAVAGLERICAELAAERMTAADHRALQSLHDRMERHHETNNLRKYFALNNDIHLFIVEAARNRLLKASHATLFSQVNRARYMALHVVGRREESIQEHRDILDALKGREGERAGKLLAHHVLHTGEAISRALPEIASPEAARDAFPMEA
jgi:DNA-binding GntR family transcriptional regulator